ncbi:hypothetical protein CR513_58403, partial [Mucuna pruriens]
MKIRSAEEEEEYWKDRYNKVVWLANQALNKLPRSLCAVEAMINPLKTPLKIFKFVNECRMVMSAVISHPYGTCAKTRQMENAMETLEQRNEETRGEITQMKEQMTKILELLTKGPPNGQNTADYPPCYTPPPYGMPLGWNTHVEEQTTSEDNHQARLGPTLGQGRKGNRWGPTHW